MPKKLRLYLAALALLAISVGYLLAARGYRPLSTPGEVAGLLAFGALGVLSFLFVIDLPTGGAVTSVVSMLNWCLVVLFGPFWAAITAAASWFATDLLFRRAQAIRTLHNVLQTLVSFGLGALLFQALGGRVGALDIPYMLLPMTAGILLYFFLNTYAVSFAVGYTEGMSPSRVWYENFRWQFLYQVTAVPIILLMIYLYLRLAVWGIVLFFIPMIMVRQAYRLYLDLKKTYKETVLALVKGIEASDYYTSGHSERVSMYARAIASAMHLSHAEVEKIEIAAILHDVGKIGSDYHALIRKPAKLTPEEYRVIQQHPVLSANLVSHVSFLRGDIEKIIRHHHEMYSGNGYPDGLRGEEIPLGARIVLVADAYDAMTTDRPYRQALSHERAIEELQRFAGYQFDPHVVEVVIRHNLPISTVPKAKEALVAAAAAAR